jgi:hypothetical protein
LVERAGLELTLELVDRASPVKAVRAVARVFHLAFTATDLRKKNSSHCKSRGLTSPGSFMP